jgi:hypothetical protein
MAIYSLAQRTTNFTIAQACWELRTTSTDRVAVLEIGFITNTATAQTIGLGRPAAQGVTPVNVTFLAEDSASPAATTVASLSWGTSPTVPANFFRRVSLPATAGAGIIWTFPRGLIVPVSASLVLWNITASVAADVWCVVDE